MTVCVYPGSFDPVTVGHLDIIRRAARLFDRVYVAVGHDTQKYGCLPPTVRVELLRRVTADLPQVIVELYEGLTVEFARACGAQVIVRGLRDASDFSKELQMAQLNARLCGQIDTVFFAAAPTHACVSSRYVREIAAFGGDIRGLVPAEIHDELVHALYVDKGGKA